MSNELANEILRWSCSKLLVEMNHEQVSHADIADQGDFVLRCREQMRRRLRSQYFLRVRIEGKNDGRSVLGPSMFRGGRNDCLMPGMTAIKASEDSKKWPTYLAKFATPGKNSHNGQ